jgi:Ca2+/Na+ antiporter
VEALSYIVLILLSLVGYSGGATGRAGKRVDLKPVILDLILVALVWAAALYSRITYDFNKWLLILVWVGIAVVVGWTAVSFRRLEKKEKEEETEELPGNIFKRIWHRWTGFSKRMGSFQSRVMLSFFFFIIVSPVALIIRVLGDPLKIKKNKVMSSYWSAKTPGSTDIADYRRQF